MLWGCSNLVWGLPRSPGHTSGEGVVSPDIHLEGERVGGRRDVLTRHSFIEHGYMESRGCTSNYSEIRYGA